MKKPTGRAVLYMYLDGWWKLNGKEGKVGEDEKNDLALKAILETTAPKMQSVEDIKNYCAYIILLALHRLRTNNAFAAAGTLEQGLSLVSSLAQSVAKQLPRDVMWAALSLAESDHKRRNDAKRQITTPDKPDNIRELEAYIRRHLPQLD